VYRKKGGKKVNPNDAYDKGLNEPKNPEQMPVRPIDMVNRGAYPQVLSAIRKLFGYE
jgi:hypothetical protein